MVISGPGVARGVESRARVGLHDLCPTLCELTGADAIDIPDSRSFATLLGNPQKYEAEFATGYAEYFGCRYWITQRIVWDGPWKLVWNGFDFDELYNLDDDPYEMHNRINDSTCVPHVRRLMAQAYRVMRNTNDHPLLGAQYPMLRAAPFGPKITD